ncbi:hypothetical protein M2352_001643 [Azospirillum fermentarium]|uniref:ATP-binding protein n=1 Tax=Azospirillum fermentarium TaxID=1233114 RepID=UPI002227C4D7|nr:ATP-binding protein [Azospirillum fermentarium]MCW2246052.1 hypothetical protein [Azospirillum fermentarium]
MLNFFRKRRTGGAATAHEGAAPAAGAFSQPPRTFQPPPHLRPVNAAGTGAEPLSPDLPRFTMPVSGGLRRPASGRGPQAEAAFLTGLSPEVNGRLREAFTPTRPKQQVNGLFIGRTDALKRIIAAVEEERAHVILFGDRGRGKTSVANAVEQIAAQAGYLALKLTCSGELSFEDIFRHFLKRIPSTYYRSAAGQPFASRRPFSSFNELLPEGAFSVTELNEVLGSLHGTHVLLILDEYDRVTDEDFRNKLAELFKNLTDSAVPVTLLVVGVAENLDQLLGKHPSIQRSLVPVHLPLMTDAEIGRLLQAGADTAGICFDADVVARITGFVRGLPYFAQLLGLHAARSAVSRDSAVVETADLAYAVNRCLQEAERGIVDSYSRALAGRRRAALEEVLYAAACCPADAYGVFDPADMEPSAAAPPRAEQAEALARLCDPDYGSALVPVAEAGRTRYRFANQMMRQYILMRIALERDALEQDVA